MMMMMMSLFVAVLHCCRLLLVAVYVLSTPLLAGAINPSINSQ